MPFLTSLAGHCILMGGALGMLGNVLIGTRPMENDDLVRLNYAIGKMREIELKYETELWALS